MNSVQHVYTVYDKVANLFGPLFEAVNDGVAIRQFRQILKTIDPNSQGDFILRCIGQFDHAENGQFKICEEREIVIPDIKPDSSVAENQVIDSKTFVDRFRKSQNRGN